MEHTCPRKLYFVEAWGISQYKSNRAISMVKENHLAEGTRVSIYYSFNDLISRSRFPASTPPEPVLVTANEFPAHQPAP